MLEKPDLQDEAILARLQEAYGLNAAQVTFLPLGADVSTAVYRVETGDHGAYFLKLRKGAFDLLTVAVPRFLAGQGPRQVIAPLASLAGQNWAVFGEYSMILYPYVAGTDGYQSRLTGAQWIELGTALKGIHAMTLPPELSRLLPTEDYSPRYREMVKEFQQQVEQDNYVDPVAAKLAAFMRAQRSEIDRLVRRTGELALSLQARCLPLVLCHADLHPGNLLIAGPSEFYIVDWDNPILAPRERDLMFFGAGIGAANGGREEALFYQGYGQVQVDRMALAYYRFERIVQDIAAFGEQLLLSDEGGEDREQSYGYFTSSFLPGHEIEAAWKTDAG
jgi:spectinomycin phosphotransferase